MRLVSFCALLMEILDKLCSGLVSVGQEVLKKSKMGKIVNVSEWCDSCMCLQCWSWQ